MFVFAAVLSVLLAIVGLAAGLPKALLKGNIPAQLQSPGGLRAPLVRFIGLAELAAAAGLLAGLFWQPIGIAAALGFAAVLVGAIGFHAKSGDYANPETRGNAMAPAILTIIAIAAAVTLVLAS
ncbi:DoxX family protein [Streptomyces sp. NBC_01728]|uniref:DoxX family protein n=1 Tax=Streptomyces sp. NBC_01728 TaxID=2975925 RepID=UPI00224FB555|nr:DoxX family protein [Streptomyces sp. NBC_01728]MCX4500649.1 DoxX family protein [Streptomyces sp. NBC_01728]